MKNTKKIVLLVSLVYVAILAAVFFVANSCHSSWCRVHDNDPLGMFILAFLPLVPTFLLSLITYKMHNDVFRSWWNFARWWTPVIIVVTVVLNNLSGGGGYLGMDTVFNGLIYSVLYGVFVLVSLVKIVRSYNNSKK